MQPPRFIFCFFFTKILNQRDQDFCIFLPSLPKICHGGTKKRQNQTKKTVRHLWVDEAVFYLYDFDKRQEKARTISKI
jgi:hypothetical protein